MHQAPYYLRLAFGDAEHVKLWPTTGERAKAAEEQVRFEAERATAAEEQVRVLLDELARLKGGG